MKTIPAGKFKAQCLSLLDEVARTNAELVVTKRGKPLAKIVPFDPEKDGTETPLRGVATFVGDILTPIGDEWEATAE